MDEVTPPPDSLDPLDPRFAGSGPPVGAGEEGLDAVDASGADGPRDPLARSLVRTQGPGFHPMSRHAHTLRIAFPLLFLAGVLAVMAVFVRALDQGPPRVLLGPALTVRAAVADRPRRVCIREDASPCAWITVVDGELAAFDTNGPLPVEYGRLGVSWCPSSGGFGANSTGSRWDAAGNVVDGPAPRGLDRFDVLISRDGIATVDFSRVTSGLLAWQVDDRVPPTGPDCDTIPFDRDPDLPVP